MKKLSASMISKFVLALIFVGAVLFLPAGTFRYWQGWLYISVIFIPFIFVLRYLLKNDPALLKRRMNFKEKESKQKKFVAVSSLFFLVGFLLPGFDFRFSWSSVPAWLVILSNIFVFIGYMIVFAVFKSNSYTARTVVVERSQKVVTTGPYSIVRHPMYAGIILMFIFTSTALGSYLAIIPFVITIPLIAFRLLNEEEVLKKGLKGYRKYCRKTKYRLIPFIW